MDSPTEKSKLHVGMRNVKTCIAVFVCLAFYRITGRDGNFLACTTAIICLQTSVGKTVSSGFLRLYGTAFGAIIGMAFLYFDIFVSSFDVILLSAPVGVMLIILLCNALKIPDSIVIGCVVFLIIVLQQSNLTPVLYSINRMVDTIVGVIVAVSVNRFIANPEKRLSTQQDVQDENDKIL